MVWASCAACVEPIAPRKAAARAAAIAAANQRRRRRGRGWAVTAVSAVPAAMLTPVVRPPVVRWPNRTPGTAQVQRQGRPSGNGHPGLPGVVLFLGVAALPALRRQPAVGTARVRTAPAEKPPVFGEIPGH